MKMKYRQRLSAILMAIVCCIPMLQSCLDEENDYSQLTIGTVRMISGNDYYFALDEGSKMYPSDTTNIHGYQIVPGQRAFIYFNLLDEKINGYDYNAIVYRIENILTKDIYLMPEEKNDSIGDDPINVTNMWITNDYLNVQYQFYYDETNNIKHMLNLIANASEAGNDEEYIDLEFRHNSFNDQKYRSGSGLVSFKLDNIAGTTYGKKGLRIRVNTLYDGMQYYTVDFEKQN